jgi:hypothetical protein
MTPADRAAGYDHRVAICQLEMSLTQVFDRPVQGRHFFEAVIRENLDLGRPDRVGLLFPLRITRTTPPPTYGYRTRVITDGVQPSLHVEYKHSHVKQYFKERHALRTETTINNPKDFYINKGVENLPHLRELGHQVNRKLLEVERVSHQCVVTHDALDRLQRPTVEAGQRVSALRFGDPRVMALLQAITSFTHLPRGFCNRDLRPHVEALLGQRYTAAQMTYDLRRLRLKGVIHRIPKTHAIPRPPTASKSRSSIANSICASSGLSGTLSFPRATSYPGRYALCLPNSTRKSRNFTRRPRLLPEKRASTVTMTPLEDV